MVYAVDLGCRNVFAVSGAVGERIKCPKWDPPEIAAEAQVKILNEFPMIQIT